MEETRSQEEVSRVDIVMNSEGVTGGNGHFTISDGHCIDDRRMVVSVGFFRFCPTT